ncbi:MAG: hypothetical protein ACRENE_11165 [Polyangiaceae bacterium]
MSIAVDSFSVYWTDSRGNLTKVSKTGGHLTELASGQTFTGGIAVDATNAYFGYSPCPTSQDALCAGGLARVPLAGGSPVVLASVLVSSTAQSIAADSSGLYWTALLGVCSSDEDAGVFSVAHIDGSPYTATEEGGTPAYGGISIQRPDAGASILSDVDGGPTLSLCLGTVNRMPAGGGEETVLATAGGPSSVGPIALDARSIYWGTGSYGIAKASKTGGPPVDLAVTPGPTSSTYFGYITAIVADGENVYWLQQSAAPDTSDGDVMMAPAGGGPSTIIASGQTNLSGLAIDATSVYWTSTGTSSHCNTDGTVMKAPLRGGPSVTLVSNEFGPVGIAVDATGDIYWISGGDATGGTVRKLTPK